jgi:hypothetical protein
MLALVAPGAATWAGEAEDGAQEAPPGTPADVALWRSGQAAGEAVVAVRAEAGRLQQRVRGERVLERLAAAAVAAGPEEAARLRALRGGLQERWAWDYELVSRPWPVDPTRVCWYPMLAFDSALRAPPGPAQADLAPARQALSTCVEQARRAQAELAEANRALAAALDEAAAALGAAGQPPAPRDEGR